MTSLERSSRARVLLVGSGAIPTEPAAIETAEANSIYAGIGELATCTSRHPFVAVVLDPAAACGDLATGIAALRRVDPTVSILVVDATGGGKTHGADGVVPVPICGSMIDAAAAVDDPPDTATTSLEPVVFHRDEGGPIAAPAHVDGPLGDVDLVEALLSSPGEVESLALRIIAQETGWTDLLLHQERPDAVAVAPVIHSETCLGYLSSHVADAAILAPWATWLARWAQLAAQQRHLRTLAYRDDLTGAWNRRFLMEFLSERLEQAAGLRRLVTVMVFDIDDFKKYNDSFGHAAGDEILCESVRLMESIVRGDDRVCRIGGDEFAVVFADLSEPRVPGSSHPRTIEVLASRFHSAIHSLRFPKLGLDAPGSLTVSGGLATFPWDGSDCATLLESADRRAMDAKRTGKDALRIGATDEQPEHGLRLP